MTDTPTAEQEAPARAAAHYQAEHGQEPERDDPAPDATEQRPGPTPAQQRLIDFVQATRRKKDLEARLAVEKETLATLEVEILKDFEAGLTQNTKVDGMTVFLHRQLWASAKDGDKPRAAQALRSVGLTDMVSETFNTNTVSAWIRELDATGQPLPDEVAAAFQVAEVHSVRTRK